MPFQCPKGAIAGRKRVVGASRRGPLGWRRPGARKVVALVASLLIAVGAIAVVPGVAWGAPFHVGDVFLTGSGSVQEFTPTGQLVQTLPGTQGAQVLCFDPASGDLVLPGYGVFDSSGNVVPSNWGSAAGIGRCVADGLGHVYVSTCQGSTCAAGVISKYDLDGSLLHTFGGLINTALEGVQPIYLALAPDKCTIYYGTFESEGASINVCTGTQQASQPGGGDDMRVLPNGEVIELFDYEAVVYDPATGLSRTDYPIPASTCEGCDQFRTLSLDPDGTSYWISGVDSLVAGNPADPADVYRLDINTGSILAQWPGYGSIAVYPGRTTPPSSPSTTGNGGPPTTAPPGRGSGAAAGTAAPRRCAPSPSQITALLSATLVPRGRAAKISALLSRDGYAFSWNASCTGRLVISWYETSAGAHLSRARTRILVATVNRSFSTHGTVKLRIALTRRGRQLLKSSRRTKLIAKGSFAPGGKSATTVVKDFTLTR